MPHADSVPLKDPILAVSDVYMAIAQKVGLEEVYKILNRPHFAHVLHQALVLAAMWYRLRSDLASEMPSSITLTQLYTPGELLRRAVDDLRVYSAAFGEVLDVSVKWLLAGLEILRREP